MTEINIRGRKVSLETNMFYGYGICPFHEGNVKTFFVKNGLYRCLVCGAEGVVEPEENDPPPEEEQTRKERLYQLNEKAAEFFSKTLHGRFGKEAAAYIRKRKLAPKTVEDFGLGFAALDGKLLQKVLTEEGFTKQEIVDSGLFILNDDGSLWFRFSNRLMFPVRNADGRIIAFSGRLLTDGEPKYKNSPETPVFFKRENLFAFDRALKSGRNYLILCEGQMDVISMHQAGYSNAVASLGTSLTEEQAKIIKDTVDRVIILYDTDRPGRIATDRAINILKKAGVQVYVANTLPAKDPDEYLKKFGKEMFRQKLSMAETAVQYRIRTSDEGNGIDYGLALDELILLPEDIRKKEISKFAKT